MLHRNIPALDRHSPFNWIVADIAARDALVVTAADLYKTVYVISNDSSFVLKAVAPNAWQALGGGGGGGGAVTVLGFSAYPAVNQNVTGGVFTKVICGTEEWDSHGKFDPVLSRFTPGEVGLFLVTGQVNTSANFANIGWIDLCRNGVVEKRGNQPNSSTYAIVASAVIRVTNAADYLEMFVTSGNNITVSGGFKESSYFQAHKIGVLPS